VALMVKASRRLRAKMNLLQMAMGLRSTEASFLTIPRRRQGRVATVMLTLQCCYGFDTNICVCDVIYTLVS
jgi:hypothetical protein